MGKNDAAIDGSPFFYLLKRCIDQTFLAFIAVFDRDMNFNNNKCST